MLHSCCLDFDPKKPSQVNLFRVEIFFGQIYVRYGHGSVVDVVRSESDWVQEVGPSLAADWSGPKVRSEVGGDIMKFDVSPVRFGYGLTWVRSGKKINSFLKILQCVLLLETSIRHIYFELEQKQKEEKNISSFLFNVSKIVQKNRSKILISNFHKNFDEKNPLVEIGHKKSHFGGITTRYTNGRFLRTDQIFFFLWQGHLRSNLVIFCLFFDTFLSFSFCSRWRRTLESLWSR